MELVHFVLQGLNIWEQPSIAHQEPEPSVRSSLSFASSLQSVILKLLWGVGGGGAGIESAQRASSVCNSSKDFQWVEKSEMTILTIGVSED